MKAVKWIGQIGILFVFYYIGTGIQLLTGLPVPGSIIGMLLLLFLLLSGKVKENIADRAATLLIQYMPLLFLPVTVGVMVYFDLFKGRGAWLIAAVLASTAIVMLSAGWVSQLLAARKDREEEHHG